MITALRIFKEKQQNNGYINSISHYLPPSQSSCILATGRSAINHLINKIDFSHKDSVLLPAYVAEGIIQPFIKSKIPIKFYKLDYNLFPDITDISEILEKDISIKLCVVIHPFGFEAPINPLLEILDKKKILLLEDCAQGVFSRYEENNLPFGGKGNFALYSLNKFLPVLDGAILLSHVNKINVSLNQNELTPINKKALDSYKKHLKNNREIFLNDDQNETRELIKKSSKQYDRYYEYISQDLGNHKLCSYSEELMESFDCEKLILSRKRNMSLIYNNLSNNKIQLLYHKNNKIVPMVVPARVFGGSRDKWIDKLSEKGVILAQQSDRWNFLSMTKDIKKYSNEGDFIKNHVLIPINEFIDEGKMCFMIESLNRMSL